MAEQDRAFIGSIPEYYDRYMGPMLFEPYALDIARRFQGFVGALLETAAGTGRVTRALAHVVDASTTITATDLNQPMLTRAEQTVRAANIAWLQADAQALPFTDDSFDGLVCQFGVMFFPDKAAGYDEAWRVLKPGGRFTFSVWDRLDANTITQIVHDAVGGFFPDDPPAFITRVPFGYHDKDQIRRALLRAGFAKVDIETVVLDTPATSAVDAAMGYCIGSPLRSEIEARSPDGLERVVATASEALIKAFGHGQIVGKGQALVITAIA